MGGLQTAHQSVIGDALKAGFQNFVDQSSTLTATTATGTPAAGYFHSTVVGRAPIPDISNDLRASLGVERIMTQSVVQLQNEFGANGEPVYAAVNDDRGLIRFVGSWRSASLGQGPAQISDTPGSYVEISFYGTGLNLIGLPHSPSHSVALYVDGTLSTSNIFSSISYSLVTASRNYACNTLVQVTSGLSLGLHTVRLVTSGGPNFYVDGFEILNANASGYINLNTGTAYIQGQKALKSAISSIHYGKDSTNTTTLLSNGKGGRIVRYLNQDGTVGEAYTAIPTSPSTLVNANHANEEVARVYHWREFGAGRTDDFSNDAALATGAAFTLDDGTTTLVCDKGGSGSNLLIQYLSTNYYTLTFVGTGLDIISVANANTGGAVYIDGVLVPGTSDTAWGANKPNLKIVSGLPYGTHTAKFVRGPSTNNYLFVKQFVVYQPKKPVVPASAIELCDYNVMANYSLATSPGTSGIVSSGVMRKMAMREVVYVGDGWQNPLINTAFMSGFGVYTNAATNYAELVFFGTGVNLRMNIGNTTYNFTYSIGVNGGALSGDLSSYTSAFNYTGSGLTYTNTTGTISGTSTGALGIDGGVFSLSLAFLSACTN